MNKVDGREYKRMQELAKEYLIPNHVTEWDYLLSELSRIEAQKPCSHPDFPDTIRVGKD